jgi:hypothetical protein
VGVHCDQLDFSIEHLERRSHSRETPELCLVGSSERELAVDGRPRNAGARVFDLELEPIEDTRRA